MILSNNAARRRWVSNRPKDSAVILTICSGVIAFLLWASQAEILEVVRGNGKIVPPTRTQMLQNLEGGIVLEVFFSEGDIVKPGEIVAKLDPTQFQSQFEELQEQRLALAIRLERLEAEMAGADTFEPSASLAVEAPEFAISEKSLFDVRSQEYKDAVENLQALVDLKLAEFDLLSPLAAKSAVSRVDLVRVEQQLGAARSELSELRNRFESERAKEYSEVLAEIKQREAQIRARQDQLFRTDVRSPVHGIVNKVHVDTIGGVVRSGDPIVEILPLSSKLRVEGRIDTKDIGFVYVGMPASVKLTAFDFSIYGSLEGTVVHVAADSIVDPDDRQQVPYYEVYIEVATTQLTGPDGAVEIRPGMQAIIELESGHRTVLQYLVKPLFRATEALTER